MTTSRPLDSIFGSVFMLAPFLINLPAGAATVTVCPFVCDQVTIQAAADSSKPGDTIQILTSRPHTEGDISLTKDLTIEGLGAGTTIIQAGASAGTATVPVFVVSGGAKITMLALTIRHGVSTNGGGITISDGSVVLEDVEVRSNEALMGRGGGIFVAAAGSLQTIRTTIDGNYAEAVGGGVAADGPVEMTDTAVTDNRVSGIWDGSGGGIWSAGTLKMRLCRLESNQASQDYAAGGGLHYLGPNLLIEDTSISANSVSDLEPFACGGGVYLSGNGAATLRRSTLASNDAFSGAGVCSEIESLIIEDCTISDNSAGIDGGGLMLTNQTNSVVRVLNSTIVGNEASDGGGIYASTNGRVVISNSTVSGNSATDEGGGIYAWLSGVELASSTVTDNTADSNADGNGNGGGIYILGGELAELRNTIIASNHDLSPLPTPRASDCAGTILSAGYNLVGSLGFLVTTCTIVGDTTGNLVGVDPLLDVLSDNGGPTETHALGPGSVAINAANPTGCFDPDGVLLDADQRHGLRQDRCDIGAFEWGAVVELVFEDGFESGSTNAWSSSVP